MPKSTQEQLRFHPSNGKTIRADFKGLCALIPSYCAEKAHALATLRNMVDPTVKTEIQQIQVKSWQWLRIPHAK